MTTFDSMGLHGVLATSLARMEYTTPTPIQAQAIPIALKGNDILGSAQTGTGKTAAFSIPLVQHLLNHPESHGLVMTPTRELGKQVIEILHSLLGPKSDVRTAFIIGGEPMGKQFKQLKNKPRLIVGTPGRIADHLRRGSIQLGQTDFLVLDETDRMLDMGFSVQLDEILEFMPGARQTLMFSATMPKNIMKMADKYLTDPQRISIGETNVAAKNIKQDIIRVDDNKKFDTLTDQLTERDGSVIIFAKTKHGTERLAKRINAEGFEADYIHGDLKQNRREKVLRLFRDKKFRILVATDVAARGLDIPHIEHVVNYDIPQVPEDYIHRIGRTARAGAEGSALCLISPQDGRKWHAIEQLMGIESTDKKKANDNKKSSRSRNRTKDTRRDARSDTRSDNRSDNRNSDRKDARSGKKFGDRKFGDRKFDKKPFDRKRDDSRSFGKKPFDKKRDFNRKPEFAAIEGNVQEDVQDTDGNVKSQKPYAKKPFSGKPRSGKPHSGKPFGKKPFAKKPFSDKEFSGKKFSGKKFSEHKFSDKPRYDDSKSTERSRNFKSKQDGENAFEKRSYDKKPSDKPFRGKPQKSNDRRSFSKGGKGPNGFKSGLQGNGPRGQNSHRKGSDKHAA